MGQLDQVSQSIGQMQGTLNAHGVVHDKILSEIAQVRTDIVKRLDAQDTQIVALEKESHERRGSARVWAIVSGFAGAGLIKVIERFI